MHSWNGRIKYDFMLGGFICLPFLEMRPWAARSRLGTFLIFIVFHDLSWPSMIKCLLIKLVLCQDLSNQSPNHLQLYFKAWLQVQFCLYSALLSYGCTEQLNKSMMFVSLEEHTHIYIHRNSLLFVEKDGSDTWHLAGLSCAVLWQSDLCIEVT